LFLKKEKKAADSLRKLVFYSMELEVSSPISSSAVDLEERNKQTDKDQVRVRRKTLVVVLEQCQRALELLNNTDSVEDDDEGDTSGTESREVESSPSRDCSSTSFGDREADEVESCLFLA
jgi:hypothetical protein